MWEKLNSFGKSSPQSYKFCFISRIPSCKISYFSKHNFADCELQVQKQSTNVQFLSFSLFRVFNSNSWLSRWKKMHFKQKKMSLLGNLYLEKLDIINFKENLIFILCKVGWPGLCIKNVCRYIFNFVTVKFGLQTNKQTKLLCFWFPGSRFYPTDKINSPEGCTLCKGN